MKITSDQLYHNIVQRVKIKFDFDKKIKPVKALRGVGREKTVKLPLKKLTLYDIDKKCIHYPIFDSF